MGMTHREVDAHTMVEMNHRVSDWNDLHDNGERDLTPPSADDYFQFVRDTDGH